MNKTREDLGFYSWHLFFKTEWFCNDYYPIREPKARFIGRSPTSFFMRVSAHHCQRQHHAEGVNIINSEGIAYHQHEVLYIIKPQENTRWRVMRYSPKGADDIRRTSCVDDIPSLRLG